MTQLIIGGIVLPETSNDKYKCYEEPLGESIAMISGRTIREDRGKVWMVEYAYDYLGNNLCRQVLDALRYGQPLTIQFLPDNGDELLSSVFIRTSLTPPSFAFSREGKGLWHNLAFTLREVTPHD